MRSKLILIALLCLILGGTASTSTAVSFRYVAPYGDDAADGLSWPTAWQSLEQADALAPDSAVVLVAAGEYRESSAGLGYLLLDGSGSHRTFLAQGEVLLKASLPGDRVLHLSGAEGQIFAGFHIEGADSTLHLVTGASPSVRFDACVFTGCLEEALSLDGATSPSLVDCDLGEIGDPLPDTALELSSCPGALVDQCRFQVLGANVIEAQDCQGLRILNGDFGTSESPLELSAAWALQAHDCDSLLIASCDFHLATGNGIGVPAGGADIGGPRIQANELNFGSLDSPYGILVGSEGPSGVFIDRPVVLDNRLEIPVGDTSMHDIFVGYTSSPLIGGNEISGGGYGFVIKGNDAALVEGNIAVDFSRQGFLDKGGHDCVFRRNESRSGAGGRCARVTNDNGASRLVLDSHWYDNDFHAAFIAFEFSSPVTPEANRIVGDRNRYHLGWATQSIAVLLGSLKDFWAMADDHGWEPHGEVFAGDDPQLLEESFMHHADKLRIELELSEAVQAWVALGEFAPTDTLHLTDHSMRRTLTRDGLLPGTLYHYAYGVTDPDGNTLASETASFRSDPAPQEPDFTILRLGDPFPNPGNPLSLLQLELSRPGPLLLSLHDIQGRRLRTLHDGELGSGPHEFRIDGRGLASGVYWIRVSGESGARTRKWLLIK
jgi:hypothetical protein